MYLVARDRRRRPTWNAGQVRALRAHLGVSQEQLAEELNVRQQTVSEWETDRYRPRGASERLLTLVAERVAFRYGEPPAGAEEETAEEVGTRDREGNRGSALAKSGRSLRF